MSTYKRGAAAAAPDEEARRAPPPIEWAAALGCSLVIGLALTWPLATRLATDLPGGAHKDGLEDAYQNVWNLWWVMRSLARLASPFVTDRLFFPDGPNLYYHTLSPASAIMAAPVTALLGPIAGFNTVALISFALGGLGMWALARGRAGHAPALVASLVFVASPFHMAALVTDGQLQIFALQWIPWYILYLLEALRSGGRRPIALAALFLTLTAWTDWYYTLFLLIFTAGAAIWEFCTDGWRRSRQPSVQKVGLGAMPLRLAAIGAISAVGAAPLVVPMLVEASRATYMTIYPADDPARLSADLLAYLTPPRLHALWGAAPWAWGVSFAVNRRFYLGVAVLGLALVGAARRPAARPWALMGLAFGVLSLGGELRVNGVGTGLRLPYALIADLPLVRLTRQPDRFNVLVTVALAMLAAHGAAALLGRAGRGWRPWLAAALAALVLVDYLPAPIVTRRPEVPPFLASLPHTDDGAILEFPFHDDVPYRDAERMLFQTVHGRPISGGYHSRLYPQPQLGLPALRDLRAGRLGSDIAAEPGGWPAALRALGYRYIVGYKQRPLGPQNLRPEDEAPFRALVEAGLGVAGPLYEDGWVIAYEVPPAAPAPAVEIRSGWWAVERQAGGAPYRWLGERAELGLVAPAPGPHLLRLSAAPAGGPRTLRLKLPGGQVDVALPAGERRYALLLDLPAGSTVIELRSLEPPTSGAALEGSADVRPISVRVSEVALAPAR